MYDHPAVIPRRVKFDFSRVPRYWFNDSPFLTHFHTGLSLVFPEGEKFFIDSVRKEHVALATLGLVLLTFKPHVGALVLLSALIWLIVQGNEFGRRVMRYLLIAGIVLFAAGFLADPNWIVSYPKMLLSYQGEGNVASCSECASLPVYVSRWMFDGSHCRKRC